MKYGYYPGCSLLGTAIEYDHSARGLLATLGAELEEIDDWVCCGATPAHATSLACEIGLDAVKAKVTRPLEGLKVASYYGCLLARLPEALRIDKVEYPTMLDDLMAAVGAEPVDWPFKTECCGAALTLARQDIVVRLSGQVVQMAKECGADVLAVACPLCQATLDMYQSDAEGQLGEQLGVPVLYFTQLKALAMGLEADQLCLEKVIVDPMPLFVEKGFMEAGVYL